MLPAKSNPRADALLKNAWAIFGTIISGANRARTLPKKAATVKMLSDRGVTMARIKFDVGKLSAIKKKNEKAMGYFEIARIGAESQGAEKLLEKIDAALVQLP